MTPDIELSTSPNPQITGRESELYSLAHAVRRLTHLTLINDADASKTADLAARAHELADLIEKHTPEGGFTPHRQHPNQKTNPDGTPINPKDLFHYDAFSGPYNPLAIPMELEWDPPLAKGSVRFTDPYVGPPDCVHGGFIAAYFDQICTLANIMNAVGGPTVKLSISYRKPTPLNEDLRFEAYVDSVTGSRVHTKASLYFKDTLTAEAEGLFIILPRNKMADLVKKIK